MARRAVWRRKLRRRRKRRRRRSVRRRSCSLEPLDASGIADANRIVANVGGEKGRQASCSSQISRRQKSTPRASAKSRLILHGFRLSADLNDRSRASARRRAVSKPARTCAQQAQADGPSREEPARLGSLPYHGKAQPRRSAILEDLADALGNFRRDHTLVLLAAASH